jgi:hypothetical protein
MLGTVLYIPFDRVSQRMRFPTVFRSIFKSLATVRAETNAPRGYLQLLGIRCLLAMIVPSCSPSIRFPVNVTLKMSRFPI